MCTMGDMLHIDTIFKFLPHTHHHGDACGMGAPQVTQHASIRYSSSWILNIVSVCAVSPMVHTLNISSCQKKLFQFSCGYEKFHYGKLFGFLVINVCNHREHYEMPCTYCQYMNFFYHKLVTPEF